MKSIIKFFVCFFFTSNAVNLDQQKALYELINEIKKMFYNISESNDKFLNIFNEFKNKYEKENEAAPDCSKMTPETNSLYLKAICALYENINPIDNSIDNFKFTLEMFLSSYEKSEKDDSLKALEEIKQTLDQRRKSNDELMKSLKESYDEHFKALICNLFAVFIRQIEKDKLVQKFISNITKSKDENVEGAVALLYKDESYGQALKEKLSVRCFRLLENKSDQIRNNFAQKLYEKIVEQFPEKIIQKLKDELPSSLTVITLSHQARATYIMPQNINSQAQPNLRQRISDASMPLPYKINVCDSSIPTSIITLKLLDLSVEYIIHSFIHYFTTQNYKNLFVTVDFELTDNAEQFILLFIRQFSELFKNSEAPELSEEEKTFVQNFINKINENKKNLNQKTIFTKDLGYNMIYQLKCGDNFLAKITEEMINDFFNKLPSNYFYLFTQSFKKITEAFIKKMEDKKIIEDNALKNFKIVVDSLFQKIEIENRNVILTSEEEDRTKLIDLKFTDLINKITQRESFEREQLHSLQKLERKMGFIQQNLYVSEKEERDDIKLSYYLKFKTHRPKGKIDELIFKEDKYRLILRQEEFKTNKNSYIKFLEETIKILTKPKNSFQNFDMNQVKGAQLISQRNSLANGMDFNINNKKIDSKSHLTLQDKKQYKNLSWIGAGLLVTFYAILFLHNKADESNNEKDKDDFKYLIWNDIIFKYDHLFLPH